MTAVGTVTIAIIAESSDGAWFDWLAGEYVAEPPEGYDPKADDADLVEFLPDYVYQEEAVLTLETAGPLSRPRVLAMAHDLVTRMLHTIDEERGLEEVIHA